MSANDGLQIVELEIDIHKAGVVWQSEECGPECRRVDQRREHTAVYDAEWLHMIFAQGELDPAAIEFERGDGHADQLRIRRGVQEFLHGADVCGIRRHGCSVRCFIRTTENFERAI